MRIFTSSCSIILVLSTIAPAQSPVMFKGHTDLIHSVAVSPDGKQLATAGFDSTIKLWDIASAKNTATLAGHTGPVYCVVYRPDGKGLASSSADKTIRFWNLADNKTTTEIKTHTDIVDQIAFSPDGKYLASGSADKSVRLWNSSDGKETKNLGAHTGAVYAVAFSRDGKYLASAGSGDNVIKIWDVAGMKEFRTIKGEQAFTGVIFTPDGKSVIGIGFDRFIRVFDVTPEKEPKKSAAVEYHVFGFRPPAGIEGKKIGPTDYDLFGIAWSRDGKTLATIGYNGTVAVWDLAA
ncbi:MAG TPA: WD40 repeat domain-containing protein, partial [Chloroflexota bacterium]|nr:WD40 repeat domain-containing protein [Chloroflexota bacterium]